MSCFQYVGRLEKGEQEAIHLCQTVTIGISCALGNTDRSWWWTRCQRSVPNDITCQWCHTARRVASRSPSVTPFRLQRVYKKSPLLPSLQRVTLFPVFLQKMADSILLNTAHPAGRTYLAFSRDGSYVLNLHRWTLNPQLTSSQLRVYGRMRLSCSHLEDREWDR